ncbi:hypothetical protein C8R48DRAFT_776651 [Suillus tomentosus]|nr:hypothetical protein C8R48DRAFT_776651 [Suillus tomentosus]
MGVGAIVKLLFYIKHAQPVLAPICYRSSISQTIDFCNQSIRPSISRQVTSGTFASRQMVSSAPAPLIKPPVSYAESVKKTPRSPNAVRNPLGDFPTVSSASGVSSSSSSSPPSNATSQLPKLLSSVEATGRSQAGASDFPELPTEISSQHTVKDHNGSTNHVHSNANNVPKAAPAVNVWTERLKGQMTHVHLHVHQPQRQPRAIVTSSVGAPLVPPRLRPIAMGTSPHPVDVPNTVSLTSTSSSSPSQTISLDGDHDDHDPFIVRMPSHLSRHSSSKSIHLVNDTDVSNWQEAARSPSVDLGGNDGGDKSRRSENHAGAHNSSNSVDLSRKSTLFALSTPCPSSFLSILLLRFFTMAFRYI